MEVDITMPMKRWIVKLLKPLAKGAAGLILVYLLFPSFFHIMLMALTQVFFPWALAVIAFSFAIYALFFLLHLATTLIRVLFSGHQNNLLKPIIIATTLMIILFILFPLPQYYWWGTDLVAYRNELAKNLEEENRRDQLIPKPNQMLIQSLKMPKSQPSNLSLDVSIPKLRSLSVARGWHKVDEFGHPKGLPKERAEQWIDDNGDKYKPTHLPQHSKRDFLFNYKMYSEKRPNFYRMIGDSTILLLIGGTIAFALRRY